MQSRSYFFFLFNFLFLTSSADAMMPRAVRLVPPLVAATAFSAAQKNKEQELDISCAGSGVKKDSNCSEVTYLQMQKEKDDDSPLADALKQRKEADRLQQEMEIKLAKQRSMSYSEQLPAESKEGFLTDLKKKSIEALTQFAVVHAEEASDGGPNSGVETDFTKEQEEAYYSAIF